jgi:DNA-binding transcriptional ArsR family regulator
VQTDVATLARSRFATTPAFEVAATLRGRRANGVHHSRRWYLRALARLDAATMDLLHALVPLDHPYFPDFLTPHPQQARETRDRMVEAIAGTAKDELALQLDFAFDGRPVHPEFAKTFGGEDTYRRWRRRPPPLLRDLLDAGDATLAEEAAVAFGRFFDAAIAEDWPRVSAVLDADVAYRAEVMADHGLVAMLAGLGTDLSWDGHDLTLRRPFDVTVDWAADGVLLIPCTAHTGPVLFVAERPRTPVLAYAARGTATLRSPPSRADHSAPVGELIGVTRLSILQHLEDPQTTTALSQLDGHSTATISYHLGVLNRGGLVTSRRGKRGVFYRRTALGDALLHGELPAPEAPPPAEPPSFNPAE